MTHIATAFPVMRESMSAQCYHSAMYKCVRVANSIASRGSRSAAKGTQYGRSAGAHIVTERRHFSW